VTVNTSALCYAADFTTGSGSGSVTLQMESSTGDWIACAAAITADANWAIFDAPSTNPRKFRWNCTSHSSGTIACYLE